jgi:tetratricopeptide (TPR) repeat protein
MAIKVRKRGEGDEEEPEDEQEPQDSEMAPSGQDPFLATSSRTIAWFSNHPNLVIGLLVVLVVAGIGIYGGMQYMRGQAVAASSGVSSALAAYEKPVSGSDALQAMTQSDRIAAPKDTFESEEARWQAIYDKSGETLDGYGSSQAAQPARITRAAAAIRLGNHEEAVELYQAFLDKAGSDSERPLVHYGLSVAHAELDNYAEAISSVEKMKEADEKFEVFAKYHKAMYLEASGKTDEAEKLYDKILQNNPDSAYKTDIERRLALM